MSCIYCHARPNLPRKNWCGVCGEAFDLDCRDRKKVKHLTVPGVAFVPSRVESTIRISEVQYNGLDPFDDEVDFDFVDILIDADPSE